YAQQKNGSVKGMVIDTALKQQAIASATITILKRSDSSLVSFTITDAEGRFEMTGIPLGDYQLLITHLNYHSASRNFILSDEKKYADIGRIIVHDKSTTLKEVVIQAPPITMIGDTVQYNAGSFKTPPNASVEKLLKKLPGIEVAKDGTITAHGKKVGRLLVDGREFFGNDPTIATKNLTADIVDKVKVFDTQSEKSALSGFDDGNSIKTIDLKLKKDKKKGLFGKLMAGGGTDDRYAAKGNVNLFKGTKQMSLLAATNNLNDNVSSVPSGGGGGGSMTITSGSGDAASGIRTTRAGGFNYNDLIGKKTDFNSSYFFNQGDQRNGSSVQRQYVLPDSSYFYNQDIAAKNRTNTHRLNLGVDHLIDSYHSIKIKPTIEFREIGGTSVSNFKQLGEDNHLSGQGENSSVNNNKTCNFSNELVFRKKFKTKGRTFLFTMNTTVNSDKTDRNTQSFNQFYRPDGTLIHTELDSVRQQNFGKGGNMENRASAVYTEPLFKSSLLELNMNNNTQQRNSEQFTYDYNAINGRYDLLNKKQSNDFENGSNVLSSGFIVHTRGKKYTYSVGAGWQLTGLQGKIIAGTKDSVIRRTYQNILPSARFQYNFTKSKNLTFQYSAATNLPSAYQLQPVADLSNLPNIREGNPNLKQEYVHNLNLNYSSNNIFKSRTLYSGIMFSRTSNKISNYDTLSNVGARYSRPINLDGGVYSLAGNVGMGFPLRILHSKMRLSMSTYYNTNREFLNKQENRTGTLGLNPLATMDVTVNDKVDLTMSAGVTFNRTAASLQPDRNSRYTSQLYQTELNWELPAGFYFSTEFRYSINTSTANNMNVILPIWDASLGKQFLKDKRGELKLEVNDLLNRNVSFNQTTFPGYIESSQVLILRRYGLLKFTYNLSKAN
ncbi:TonB-dependent receptor, partial [Pedobacter borealis]|uniref:TonB-dependent receptor n=1 Tax=Pedobacter borealis TaxID=475254 RepID=UPI000493B48F